MRDPVRIGSLLLLTGALLFSQSASNGIGGGFVGSSRWFADMRESAANRAMLQTLAGSRGGSRTVPPGYVEFAGLLTFPHGNPFPGGRLPDLRIRCANPQVDPVERAPFLDRTGGFYTVLKRGQTYVFSWMYYFGSKEAFLSLRVPPDAPSPWRKVLVVPTAAPRPASTATAAAPPAPAATPALSLAEASRFDLSGFPPQPTTFEEQQVQEAIRTATTSPLKAFAHRKLAAYYAHKGDPDRAREEAAKADFWSQQP